MATNRIEWNTDDLGRFAKQDPALAAELSRIASRIATAAGGEAAGMRSRVYQGRDRQRAQVWTGTHAARRAEANDRALTRALDAGRS